MRRYLVIFSTFLVASLSFSISGCDKEDLTGIEAIVVEEGGCFANSWVVRITAPESLQMSLLCASSQSPAQYDCSNSFYINLPPDLATVGTRIYFTGPKIIPTCLSSTGKPPHIEVQRLWKK